MSIFKLHSPFEMTGDHPQAVAKLVDGIERGMRDQVLLGVTGSGKTFTMANVIALCGNAAAEIRFFKATKSIVDAFVLSNSDFCHFSTLPPF